MTLVSSTELSAHELYKPGFIYKMCLAALPVKLVCLRWPHDVDIECRDRYLRRCVSISRSWFRRREDRKAR